MNLMEKLNLMLIKAFLRVEETLDNERGSMMETLVLLGIGLALAGVLLVYKDQILGWVDTNIGDFFNRNGGR